MDADAIGALLFFAAIATSIYLRIRRQGRQRVYITDYQCGLRYDNGAFAELLGPGSYGATSSRRQITVVDMRPRQIVVERIFYQDALQSPSVVSIGAELSVVDAYAASNRLKDQTGDSVNMVRDAVRSTVSKSIAGHSEQARLATAREIEKTADAELRKFGMSVSNVEITEAWSRAVEPRKISGAN